MILVIVVAAVVAVVLLGLIIALGRPRSASDESERFRFVSDLTSQWSRQQQNRAETTTAAPADAAPPGAAAAPGAAAVPIDLRDGAAESFGRPTPADRR